MENKDWIMIVALILSPLIALQTQKVIERYQDIKKRRSALFHTLMSTRLARLSYAHVEALNMIDIEFYGRIIFGTRIQSSKCKAVTTAWKTYKDHLNTKYSQSELENWIQKGIDLFSSLLFHMSKALGYDFDEVQLKRDCYSPMAHGEREEQELIIRKGFTDLFSIGKPLPLYVVNLNSNYHFEEEINSGQNKENIVETRTSI